MSVWLGVVEWVTYTEEQLQIIEDEYYQWPRYIGDNRIADLVKYQYDHCIGRIGGGDIIIDGVNYSCENQSMIRTAENGAWGYWVVSPTNDYWICQLQYKRHKDFIDSDEFDDPINQIHYCQEVWEDAMRKQKMPRYAYRHRNAMRDRFIFNQ